MSSNKKKTHFPIVGIGASAGGLAVFGKFFSGMPKDKDPGMAFVLVQHLAPDHKSILTDLIRRHTRMRVFEVEDGVVVEQNCIYIINQLPEPSDLYERESAEESYSHVSLRAEPEWVPLSWHIRNGGRVW